MTDQTTAAPAFRSEEFLLRCHRFAGKHELSMVDIRLGPDHVRRLVEDKVAEVYNLLADEMCVPGREPSVEIAIRVDVLAYDMKDVLRSGIVEDTPEARQMMAAGAERAANSGRYSAAVYANVDLPTTDAPEEP